MEIAYCKQPHRMCTALAEQYGPIFKFRILCFHVRYPWSPVDMYCMLLLTKATSLKGRLHHSMARLLMALLLLMMLQSAS